MRFKKFKKKTIYILAVIGVLLTTGTILGINGYFGGGGRIPEDTFTRGLVGYWSFDEASGQTAYDASGNSNNGTLGASANVGADDPKWITGKTAGALQFDGVNDYVDAGTLWPSQNISALTVEFWAKFNTFSQNHGLPSKGVSWLPNSGYQFFYGSSCFYYNFRGTIGQSSSIIQGYAAVTNTWYHIAFTFQMDNETQSRTKIYVNNNVIANLTNNVGPIAAESNNFLIGKSHTNFFNGTIDEVRIYNRALSAEEIRYHYNRGAPVAQWKMDEGSGQRIYDSTDNNKDGYLASSTDVSVSDPAWVQGKFGSALSFDGVNDYASTTVITGVSAFSHSLWFKSSDGVYSADEYLFSQGVDDPSAYLESTDNKVKVMADGADKISSVKTVNDNQWHHLEITADAATLKLYLDGILESSASYTGSSATGVIYIGAKNSTPTSPFGGIIDDVRVYNYARTADEIRLDYNAGFAAKFGGGNCNTDPGSCMTKGLVGYWSFDEASGQTAYDASGNSNNGMLGASTAVGKDDPKWITGKTAGALQFDGVDDYVNMNALNVSNSTVLLWFKFATNQACILTGQASSVMRISSGYESSNLYVGAGAGVNVYPFAWTFDTNWHHLAFTYNGSNLNAYLDGVSKTLGTAATLNITNTSFQIGARNNGGSQFFNGLIDEVRIYNRALSAEEIRYHYNRGGPVAQWKFDEGSGTTTYDAIGNVDAIFPTATTNQPVWSSQ